MIDHVKVQPQLLFLIRQQLGPFLHFLEPLELLLGLISGSKTFLGPSNVNNQLWFCKYSPIFLFLIRPHFGPLLHLSFGDIIGVGIRFKKTCLGPTNGDYQCQFWKCSLICLFLIRLNYGLFCTFWTLRAFWRVGVRINLHRQSTFVFDIHYYLFVFYLATFGASFALFWALRGYCSPLWRYFQVMARFKTFFGTFLCCQSTSFWKYSHIFLILTDRQTDLQMDRPTYLI